MSSKFGASEMRLDLLDPCVPLEYPVNVYSDVFDRRQAAQYNKLAGLLETAAWPEALQFIGSPSVAFLKDLKDENTQRRTSTSSTAAGCAAGRARAR